MSGSMSNREQAAALLMREVICEKVYREMQQFKSSGAGELTDHPCRALGMRTIWPRDLMPFVVTRLLRLDKDALRAYAAAVLDMLEKRVEPEAPAAEATKTAAVQDGIEWCYATDTHGENWNECDTAVTREDAIAEATEYARGRSGAEPQSVRVGWKRSYTHEDFVGGLGEDVRECIQNRAYDEGGEHAEEYPDMKSELFDEALDGFVLDWLNTHADAPRFFTVEGEEEVDVSVAGADESISVLDSEDQWPIHAAHCCAKHGCKYSDDRECPVAMGKIEREKDAGWCQEPGLVGDPAACRLPGERQPAPEDT